MKKILFILFTVFALLFNTVSIVSAHQTNEEGINFNWLYLSQAEKEKKIMEVFKIMFPNGYASDYPKKTFKENLKEYLKDADTDIHYDALRAGYSHYKNVNLEAFKLNHSDIIYMYALQYKEDLQKTFYYDALGKLKFVDFRYGNYPNYPFYTKKYTSKGKLVRAMYMSDYETTYIYSDKGEFIGVKYHDTVYGKNFTK